SGPGAAAEIRRSKAVGSRPQALPGSAEGCGGALMPPSKHAVLSASGAHRWLHCNPSPRLELEFADREPERAAEGTAAPALAEHKLKKALKIRSRKPVSPYDCDEMDAHTDGYVEFVLEQLVEAKTLCADPLVLIEQRLDFS